MSTRPGYDTAAQLTSQSKLNVLIHHHADPSTKFFIGRYLKDDVPDPDDDDGIRSSKQLTENEVKLISANDIDIVSIFELHTYKLKYYNQERGTRDAGWAVERAALLHQPSNTPIYFAIEIDFQNESNANLAKYKIYLDAIRTYLSNTTNNPNGYLFGYYGPSYSGMTVKIWYSNAYIMVGRPVYNLFTNWTIKQQQPNVTLTYNGVSFKVDIDTAKTQNYGGWQYHQYPNSWTNYNNASKHRRKCTLCNKYEYQYHVPNATGNRCIICNYIGNIVVPANSAGDITDEYVFDKEN